MKKILFLFVLLQSIIGTSQTQNKLNDFGRIVLNTYLPNEMKVPNEAKALLETKLNQISTNNGIGGGSLNPRFIITAFVNIGTKDIISGPPQMIAQNLDISIFIGDAIENKIYSSVIIPLKGVGTNENKSFIDAIKNLNTKAKPINLFIGEGKNKIIEYYNTKCDFILQQAESLAKREQFNEAIYKLSTVPEVCKECYFKSLETTEIIYKEKINNEGKNYLYQARAIWATNQDSEGASRALENILKIDKNSSSFIQVDALLKTISNKLSVDEKERLEQQKQTEKKEYDLENKRIEAYREIALEYAKNQPRKEIYYNIIWR